MLQKAILEKLRFTGGLWIAAGPSTDREYCSECRTVFCGSFETESVQKEMNVLSVVVFQAVRTGTDCGRSLKIRQICNDAVWKVCYTITCVGEKEKTQEDTDK